MKNVLAFIGYRLQRRLLTLSIVTFLLGLFLATLPGFLGCPNWWWLRWTILLEPVWLLGDLFTFNFDFYPLLMHLFCCLLWLSVLAWIAQLVGLFRPDQGEFYDTKPRAPGSMEDLPPATSTIPWTRLLVPPGLLLVLTLLVITEIPLRISFALHRDALTRLVTERLEADEPDGRFDQTRWVGIYPIQFVGTNRPEGAAFTESGYDHFFSRGVYGGFVYKGKPAVGESTETNSRLDDDWQAYRRGGGRAELSKKLP